MGHFVSAGDVLFFDSPLMFVQSAPLLRASLDLLKADNCARRNGFGERLTAQKGHLLEARVHRLVKFHANLPHPCRLVQAELPVINPTTASYLAEVATMSVLKAAKNRVVSAPISNAKTTFGDLKRNVMGVVGEGKSQIMKGHPSGYTSGVRVAGAVNRPTVAKVPIKFAGGLIDTGLGAVQRARSANRRLLHEITR